MMRVTHQEDWQPKFPNEFHERQEIGPIEGASLEFHQVLPNEPPLEWRRLFVNHTKQTAHDANNQTCKERSPKILDI